MLFNFMTIGHFFPTYFKGRNVLYFSLFIGGLIFHLNHKFFYEKLEETEISVIDLSVTVFYVIGSFLFFIKTIS